MACASTQGSAEYGTHVDDLWSGSAACSPRHLYQRDAQRLAKQVNFANTVPHPAGTNTSLPIIERGHIRPDHYFGA